MINFKEIMDMKNLFRWFKKGTLYTIVVLGLGFIIRTLGLTKFIIPNELTFTPSIIIFLIISFTISGYTFEKVNDYIK